MKGGKITASWNDRVGNALPGQEAGSTDRQDYG